MTRISIDRSVTSTPGRFATLGLFRLLVGAILALQGCTSGTHASGAGSAHATAERTRVANDEFVRFKRGFGLLQTIAGKGESDDGNEWQSSFEGRSAVQVELSRPHIALADAAGRIYIADKEAHAIRRVSVDGLITTVAGTNAPGNGPDSPMPATKVALRNPNGLWVQPNGTLFVLDLDNSKIRKMTPDGMMHTVFRVAQGIAMGRGLWVSADENEIFVCSGDRLLRWTPTTGERVWATGFSELGMVVRDESGRLLAGDRRAHRVFEIRAQQKVPIAGNGERGEFVAERQALETPLAGPRAIWPYQGGLFIGLHDGSRVVYLDRYGIVHDFLDGDKNAHGGDAEPFDSPGAKVSEVRSVAATASGELIVVENDLGFVRMVGAAGR